MRRTCLLILAALAGSSPAQAGWSFACWSITANEGTTCGPYVDSLTEPWIGDRTLYLRSWWALFAMNGAEFDIGGTLEVVSFTPRPGWVNRGTATSLQLERLPCDQDWSGGEVVGELVVRDTAGSGGQLCFLPHAVTTRACSRQCTDWGPDLWLYSTLQGFSSTGTNAVCDWPPPADCETLTLDSNSWGEIRSQYR